jgi:hypothetical protein
MATELDTTAAADTGLDPGSEETSLRDDLDAAFEEHATDDPPANAPAATGRARDASGRFATGSPPAPAPAPDVATTGNLQAQAAPNLTHQNGVPNAGTAPAPSELKAPASWRPEIREKWASIPPDVQAEVHRREYEAQRVLQTSAGQRQFVEAFEKLMQPYEMFIRAENSNPLQAVDNMMRTAAQLRVGTPAAKVEIVAGIIKNFGIDLPALDAVLAGQISPQQLAQRQPAPIRDPRVDQMLFEQQNARRQQDQFADQAIRHGLSEFATKHEFYGDVANTMADIVEIQTRQGRPVDIEQVYQQACQMNPSVSTILQQRAQAQNTGTQRAAVLRAKRAAVSVKGDSTPHGATIPKNDSVRAAIEAAWDTSSD